jgi:uncharacterized protein YcbX
MRVDQIWRYPVKSLAGEQLDATELLREGIPGDRMLYVLDGAGRMLSARTHPRLLGHTGTLDAAGEVLVDGIPWYDAEVEQLVRAAAGKDARLVPAQGPERFDILPLLVATDGAIRAFGHDGRRLRPNIVLGGVEGLAERDWEGARLRIGDAVIRLDSLRARCVMTTFHPDTLEQDVEVLKDIGRRFGGKLALNAAVEVPGVIALGDGAEILPAG